MYYRAIRNDMLKRKAITLTTTLFVAAAALLISLAAILVVNLTGAIDTLMTRAKTPHFMQMHTGDLDTTRLTTFAAQNDFIAEFQVLEFLNIEGAQIRFADRSLAGSVQDNGLAVQSKTFDFLLDLDGNIIQASDGEIYVPLSYIQDGSAKVGETVEVAGKAFVIAGALRDSQMQSLLASSKRFLVSPHDFAELRDRGGIEYLIEFRLHDLAMLGAFETAYTAAALDANGPTITYPLFRLLNGLSDGLMIAVILLVSVLVLAIAFLCIRFTLLAKIEDDYREIGVMKAIGLRIADIKRLYLATYAVIAATGSLLGFALALVVRDALLANIRLYMGESANAALAPLLGIVGVILVFTMIMAYVNGLLNRFRNISPAEAIRFGNVQEQAAGLRLFNLSENRVFSTNVFLGLRDVLVRKKLYVTMLVVLVLATFIMIVPQNLSNTVAAKEFVAYMGIGDSDLRIDLQQTDELGAKAAAVALALEDDAAVASYVVLTTKAFRATLPDGSERRMTVELGDHGVFPIAYAAGRSPAAADEIALSIANADELGAAIGDQIVLTVGGQQRRLTVCGIYSDVTNGGKTAKATFAAAAADTMWIVINADLHDPALVAAKAADYSARFAFAKVTGIDAFVAQTFGPTIRAIGQASIAAIAVALVVTILITLLFMRMLVVKDRSSIAVMKAFGFTNGDIKQQYLARAVGVLLVGVLLGTLLANTLGQTLAGMVIASFGAASFTFVINPWVAYLLSPLLIGVATLGATIGGTLDAGQISIAEYIKD
jgi:putative ABC transport system permease protein